MIPVPSGVKVWLATGHAERLSRAVADGAGDAEARPNERSSVCLPRAERRPDQGDLARRPGCACLFTKKLERGRFIWPSAADGTVVITPAQLGYLLEGIDWRMPQKTWRPSSAG